MRLDRTKFWDFYEFLPKSSLKASDGMPKGRYPFFTSSAQQTKWTDSPIYEADALIFATGGAAAVHHSNGRFATSADCFVAHPRQPRLVHPRFTYHFLRWNIAAIEAGFHGAGLRHVSKSFIKDLPLPELPLSEQVRLTEILDKADALRAKRRADLAQLDTLTQSIFLDMFGDPATNPKEWQCMPLGEVATKFSDGPFGSNLKTEHYTASGVRVIRLQNIGVGEFLDDNKAYISEQHFASLAKHECLPGDVLIGTLGIPNLRACIQPEWLTRALNKADCVQLRPDMSVANAVYLCTLLNIPSVEQMAQALVLGQTRLRISMGRLRGLNVPVPPIDLQNAFARRANYINITKSRLCHSLVELDALFASLQHCAFKGEL